MHSIKNLALLSLLLAAHAAVAQSTPEREEWITLFNGRDLAGWTPKITKHAFGDNYANTFRVKDGVLRVSYENYDGFDGQFGHLFYKEPFGYYRLRVEYRFFGEQPPRSPPSWARRNSGVMFHSQAPQTMHLNQTFPISIEAQFLGGLGDGQPRSTLNVCSPGTEIVYRGAIHPTHCLNSTSKTFDGDQWVQAELTVLGSGLVTQSVNGEVVLEYALPQLGGGEVQDFDAAQKSDGKLLEGGYIAVQSESHPVEFRNIQLLNLAGCMDPKAKNYKKYFVKAEGKDCRY